MQLPSRVACEAGAGGGGGGGGGGDDDDDGLCAAGLESFWDSARGAGAGRALLARLAQLAIERDCARLEWSVLDWNEPAIAVYRAIGAVPMDEWTVQRLDGDALRALAATTRSPRGHRSTGRNLPILWRRTFR